MKNVHLAILCASIIIIVSASGCIWNDEKEEKETYVLEAAINVDKNVVYQNEIITFDASGSEGDELEYYWDFDNSDGFQWVKDKTTTHSYTEYGAYTVTLKVVDINEEHDYEHVNVCVNYKAEYPDNITKDEGEKSYFFPLKGSAKSAVITLEYLSSYEDLFIAYKPNTNNLDLYIYYNESDDSEVKNSSDPLKPNAQGTIEEVVELSRNDLLYNLTGMRASVKWAPDCVSDAAIEYTLSIEIYYNS